MKKLLFILLNTVIFSLHGQEIAKSTKYCYTSNAYIEILGYHTHFDLPSKTKLTFTSPMDTFSKIVGSLHDYYLSSSVSFAHPGVYQITVTNDSDGTMTASNDLQVLSSSNYYLEFDSLYIYNSGNYKQMEFAINNVQDTIPRNTSAFFTNLKNDTVFVDSINYLGNKHYNMFLNIPSSAGQGFYTFLLPISGDTTYYKKDALYINNFNDNRIDSVTPHYIWESGNPINAKIYGHKTHFTNNTLLYPLLDTIYDINIVNDSLIEFKWINFLSVKAIYDVVLSLYNPVDGYLTYYPIYYEKTGGISGSISSRVGLNIYPNPASTQFGLILNDNVKYPLQLDIYDISGKLVISKKVEYISTISTNGIKTGIYNLKITDGNNKVYTKKLIIK